MNKITPFLWFDTQAEDAMNFYASVFKDSEILSKSYGPDGKLFTGSMRLNNQEFMVLNAGPIFKFNEAVSFFVDCKDQKEVDYFWNKLTADGGEESMCGWLKDKFGLSWQIVPKRLNELLGDKDRTKADRAMQCMLKMHKLVIKELEDAFEGK